MLPVTVPVETLSVPPVPVPLTLIVSTPPWPLTLVVTPLAVLLMLMVLLPLVPRLFSALRVSVPMPP